MELSLLGLLNLNFKARPAMLFLRVGFAQKVVLSIR
jgi:hypothetical protein